MEIEYFIPPDDAVWKKVIHRVAFVPIGYVVIFALRTAL